MTTANQIRAFCDATGMSARELARRAGLSSFIVHAILRGQCPITDRTRRRIDWVIRDVKRKLSF